MELSPSIYDKRIDISGLFDGLLPAEFQEKLVYPDKPPILQVRF
jgi:hypothetical protein